MVRLFSHLTSGHRNFRDSLRTVSPPSIPFLGLYLQDLTFIEDGNPNFLDEEKGLINMAKRAQYSQLIMDIQMYQQTPYLLQPVPLVSDWLRVRSFCAIIFLLRAQR